MTWRAPAARDLPRPPVCVCDDPDPDGIGQCSRCGRPHKVELAAVRDAWRDWADLFGRR